MACTGDRKPPHKPVRLVLVTIDTLRYDSFAGRAERPSAMPLTVRRAGHCLVFERFFSATSTTQPSQATLLTALHPWEHGVTRNGIVLAEEITTLAERLREAGFKTAAVVASAPVSRKFGFAQGFDEFHDDFSHVLRAGADGAIGQKYYSLAESVTKESFEMLDRMAGAERQFLWIHYFDPHAPYGDSRSGPTVRPMQLVKRIVDGAVDRDSGIRQARMLYELDIAYLDRSLEHFFKQLANEEDDVETHLLVTADHGESFGEDGSMAHGRRLTAGQIHVPTFLCSPRVEAGVNHEVAGSIDIAPTLLSLAGVKALPMPGRDLTRPSQGQQRAFGMKTTQPYQELRLDGQIYDRSPNLFYMVDNDGTVYRGNGEQLLEPPTEADGPSADLAGQLRILFGSFEAQLQSNTGAELNDPETRRALNALGYVR